MSTKDRIMTEALKMFSDKGYASVSIRDIAKAVDIKESSIYYHYKNKQDILDSLIEQFEKHIRALSEKLNDSTVNLAPGNSFSAGKVNQYFFEYYLFEPFCNQMLRFLMIEQFQSGRMALLYDYYLFELPYNYQVGFFLKLSQLGMMSETEANRLGKNYYAAMTMLTFKHLLNGELTEDKKDNFRQEAGEYMTIFLGGNQ